VKPPAEQPKEQPGLPTKATKKDLDEKAIFVITAGEELTIGQLLEQIKKMTGKEIIPFPGIAERRIKFVSSFKANYTVLEKILNVNQVTLEHMDEPKMTIIAQLQQQLPPRRYGRSRVLGKDEELPSEMEIVTAILEVQYADPKMVEQTIGNRIMDKQGPGQVISVQNQPVLIVRDFAPEVEYYKKIIKAIDIMPKGVQLFMIRLEHAVASDIANYLSQLGGQQRKFSRPGLAPGAAPDTGFEAQFVADARTNKLIILTFQENFVQIERVVKELDEEIPRGTGNIHIVQLKHVSCTKLATALQSVLTGRQTGVRGAGGQLPEQLQEIPTRVVAEEQTNSLIVEAEQRNYEELVRLIEQLDVRRPQVLIEAAIIEVTANSTTNLGIELATVDLAGTGFRGAGASLFNLSTFAQTGTQTDLTRRTPAAALGLNAIVYRDSFDRIPFLLHALRTNGDVNVLSSPRLLTNDNEKGELKVTEQVATATSTLATSTLATTSFGGYQEAGITLSITPHISTDNYLRLEIDLKVEAFSAAPVAGSITPPPKTSRQVTAIVTVPDKEIVIIGGLTNERETETVNKIPLLGDIPLLGALFRSTESGRIKTNLYVFLTPHIISEEKFDTLKKMSIKQREDAHMHGGHTERLGQFLEDVSAYHARAEMRAYREMMDTLRALFGRDFEKVYILEKSGEQPATEEEKK
jgi:general secretion pathway protein D